VQINPWETVEKPAPNPALGQIRAKASPSTTNWWWN